MYNDKDQETMSRVSLNVLQVTCNSDKLRLSSSSIDRQNVSNLREVVLICAHFDRDQVCAQVDQVLRRYLNTQQKPTNVLLFTSSANKRQGKRQLAQDPVCITEIPGFPLVRYHVTQVRTQ